VLRRHTISGTWVMTGRHHRLRGLRDHRLCGLRACWGAALAAVVAGSLASACGAGPAATDSRPSGTAALSSPSSGALADSSPSSSGSMPASPDGTRHAAAPGASASGAKPLAGKIVGIDPGHDGLNGTDSAYIDQLIWNGTGWEACDTTGTETDSGYTEAQFNFNVASYLRTFLQQDGAGVVMTRQDNDGIGPCVNRRSQIINEAHASVAIDIHADGGPSWGRGFTVLEPVADGPNDKVISSSERFGGEVRSAFLAGTSMPASDYYGNDGIIFRADLAGLNLTTVPKVLIECGNMRNGTDASLLTSTNFQKRIARALLAAIIRFLS
jgi:N-acetylmuramoyl-L-alanine amidase